jgi:hypothetical protein
LTKTIRQGLAAEGIVITTTGDDKGTAIENGQFSVGTKDAPNEAVFGEGDSYPIPYALHFDGISTYTDVSEILQSDESSTTGLFGGTTSGRILYLGSDHVFHGSKVKISTVGSFTPLDSVLEEWTGSAWTDYAVMATGSVFPKNQYAWNLCNNSDSSEQWRFGFDPANPNPGHSKTTVNGIEAYWWRFRLVSGITTDPILQQIKLHTSRVELDEGGMELFGNARQKRYLLNHFNLSDDAVGFSPGNEAVYFSSNIAFSPVDNKMTDNAIDAFGGTGTIPTGVDTSIKIEYNILFQPKNTNTGNVELQTYGALAQVGQVLDSSGADVMQSLIIPVDGTEDKVYKATFYLDGRNALVGETLGVLVKRDATAGNDNDTYQGNIAIISTSANAYFWQ